MPPKMPRPRWLLHLQAHFWRVLMALGMWIHRLAPPRPMGPSFSRTVPVTLSPKAGQVHIRFYVPKNYNTQKKLGKKKFPVVVNFHGGGFTLGTAMDDARWSHTVVEEVGAVVASVDYRLAPEHPFPTAVEDGVDAIMYLIKHADDLCVDPDRMAVSGFSSGGNMAFTVPLRLEEEVNPDFVAGNTDALAPALTNRRRGTIVRVVRPVSLAAVVSFYPSTDYTQTRDQRRATNIRKDQELSAVFTELFDESYLQPPTLDMSNPYLSPGVAPDHILKALPQEIILFTCEYDMLLAEGERMKNRLVELGKKVTYTMVPGVPHGWDKAPNPTKWVPGVREHYLEACKELRRAFKLRKKLNADGVEVLETRDTEMGSISKEQTETSVDAGERQEPRESV